MVDAYARAGFAKLHLDTSMGCAGEPAALPDALVAERAADLAAVAEAAAAAGTPPVYVIGTEVPVPGGATEALDHLAVTSPGAAIETVAVHRRAFAARGLDAAFARAIAAVVQPGVEFSTASVAVYRPEAAGDLSAALAAMPGFVFEAHSTDYQPPAALAALVRDGFAILKVGPALTFALREALYGLDHIAAVLDGDPPALEEVMERVMLAEPAHWRRHLHGSPDRPAPRPPLRLLRPHPLLLAGSRGPGGRRPSARPPRRHPHSRAPGQPVSREPLSRGRRRAHRAERRGLADRRDPARADPLPRCHRARVNDPILTISGAIRFPYGFHTRSRSSESA